MLFKNSQDDVEFNDSVIPVDKTKVGIKLSGGTDSAILCYMLAAYCKESRPDVVIHPITFVSDGKPYNMIFASEIVKKISQLLDFHNFGEHYFTNVRTNSASENTYDQEEYLDNLYLDNKIDIHFNGVTLSPDALNIKGLPPDRVWTGVKKPQSIFTVRTPFINTDKKGVYEHYVNLGVLESLFPLTRSCEKFTDDFSKHCEECWFCKERFWAFGRYE